jgi:hypothetical protein
MNERIMKLLDTTQPFCPGLNQRFSLRNDSGKLFGEFYLRDATRRKELEAVLRDFDDILVGSRIFDPEPTDVTREHIALGRYEDLELLAAKDLSRIVDKVRVAQGDDEVYSLSVWLDPAQGGLCYCIRCEAAFRAALQEKRDGPGATHYESERQVQQFRFYDHVTLEYDPNDVIRKILGASAERGYQNYLTYGERYLGREGSQSFEFLTDAVARALTSSRSIAMERLRTSKDFLMYVQYYDQDDLTHFRAARKTVSAEDIQLRMGEIYGDLARIHMS